MGNKFSRRTVQKSVARMVALSSLPSVKERSTWLYRFLTTSLLFFSLFPYFTFPPKEIVTKPFALPFLGFLFIRSYTSRWIIESVTIYSIPLLIFVSTVSLISAIYVRPLLNIISLSVVTLLGCWISFIVAWQLRLSERFIDLRAIVVLIFISLVIYITMPAVIDALISRDAESLRNRFSSFAVEPSAAAYTFVFLLILTLKRRDKLAALLVLPALAVYITDGRSVMFLLMVAFVMGGTLFLHLLMLRRGAFWLLLIVLIGALSLIAADISSKLLERNDFRTVVSRNIYGIPTLKAVIAYSTFSSNRRPIMLYTSFIDPVVPHIFIDEKSRREKVTNSLSNYDYNINHMFEARLHTPFGNALHYYGFYIMIPILFLWLQSANHFGYRIDLQSLEGKLFFFGGVFTAFISSAASGFWAAIFLVFSLKKCRPAVPHVVGKASSPYPTSTVAWEQGRNGIA